MLKIGRPSLDIYLLETDPYEVAALTACLEARHHGVVHFDEAGALMNALSRHRPQLVVLDPMAVDGTGLPTLRRIRELYGAALPLVMVACEERPECIVQALETGADDYIIKPVLPAVLVARIEALLRRVTPQPQAQLQIERGPYRLDYRAQSLTVDGEAIVMTPKEFDLAWALFSLPDGFISRHDLIAAVWGKSAHIAGHTFAQHIYLLRKKLKLQEHGFRLTAVYGAGYRMESPPVLQAPMPVTPPARVTRPAGTAYLAA